MANAPKKSMSERLFLVDRMLTELEAEFTIQAFMPGSGMTQEEAVAIRNGIRAIMDHTDTGESDTVVGRRILENNLLRTWTSTVRYFSDPVLAPLLGKDLELGEIPRLTPLRGRAAKGKVETVEPTVETETEVSV